MLYPLYVWDGWDSGAGPEIQIFRGYDDLWNALKAVVQLFDGSSFSCVSGVMDVTPSDFPFI